MIKRSVILAVLSMALLSTLRLSAQGLEGKIVELQATQISREFNKQYGYRFKIGDQSTPLASVDNMTTNVIRAVKTHGLVVILGSIGAEANLITILDAKSRQECAELMCYSPQLSPNGQYVAFRRFFPHLTKPELVNDTIAILRLPPASKGRATACETTAVHGAPPIDLGTDILNLRGGSSFLAPIIWNEAGDSFNFLAGTVGNGFIVGRVGLIDGQWKVTKSLPQEINGSAAKPINAVVSGFTQDDSGVLVVHVAETNDPTRGTIQMEMLFDALTLSPLKGRGLGLAKNKYLELPWAVAQNNLIKPGKVLPIRLGSGEITALPIRLTISNDGSVISIQSATVIDNKSRATLEATILQWKFRPTLLNGSATEITTEAAIPVQMP